jgi:hypothetical protein
MAITLYGAGMTKRLCGSCGAELARRPNERPGEFAERQTCGGACARRLTGSNRRKARPLAERFWDKVKRGGADECWPWTARVDDKGYGQFKVRHGLLLRAHQVSWDLHFGTRPDGAVVRHTCDNPPCVNPAHLELGSHGDNADDRETRGRTRGVTVVRRPASDIAEMRRARATGVSQRDIARAFGVSQPYVSRVVRGLRRRLH